MYKDLIGSKVTAIVSSRAETLLEYRGIVYEEKICFVLEWGCAKKIWKK